MFRNAKRGREESSTWLVQWRADGSDDYPRQSDRSVRQRSLDDARLAVPDRELTARDLELGGCQHKVITGLLDSVVPPPHIKDEFVPHRRALAVRSWVRQLLDSRAEQMGMQARLLAGAVEALAAMNLFEETVEAIVNIMSDEVKTEPIIDTRIEEVVCEPKAGSGAPDLLAAALHEHVHNPANQSDHVGRVDQFRQLIFFKFSKVLNKRDKDSPIFEYGDDRHVSHLCGDLDPLSLILKELCNKVGVPHEDKGLLFGGRRLDLSKNRNEYNIHKESTVYVLDNQSRHCRRWE